MSPREAAQTDPAQRLLLLTTYEALEMAGYTPDGTPSTASDRIGTFFGQTLDDYREANASQNIEMYYATGGIRAFGAGRLNYHFKWEGPSYCVDAACSSSALAIQMAMTSLRTHECDTAVAGGTNVLTGSEMYSGLSRGSFLSPTGSCKTFDNDADGYCRGDGVGSVVLKRLEDAIAEGDNIQAVIKSAATNHSAHAVSITHPHAETQQKLMRRALREADLEPGDIDYVEMHGTGTQAGDATEFSSVTNVLANRAKDNPLHVGAVKANFGHAEAAAGTNSLVKILMMMRKNAIPPHVGIKGRINEKFPPLDKVNVRIDTALTPFKARNGGDGKRRILLNNFNATGGNTSLIIEDPPEIVKDGQDPRTTQVVAISAKTSTSFKQNTQRLLEYIESHPETQLRDLSYTTTARRMHHVVRKAYAAESLDSLTQSIKKDLANPSEPSPVTESPSAIFVFTGQGAQYLGMGKQLFETNTAFRKSIIDFDSICLRQGLPSFKWIINQASSEKKTPSPSESQLALVSIAMALASLWKSWGITPSAVIGHSLGEYAALCVAGVLSVSDTIYLVGMRAQMMEKKCIANSHAMLAIQSGVEPIEQILSAGQMPSCSIACFNGPNSTVVSGKVDEISSLGQKLDAAGVKKTLLELPFAFHSVQMDPILDDIRVIAQNVEFREPAVPVASTLLGSVVKEKGTFTPSYLTRQAREAVKFQGALEACRSLGIARDETLWVEMGAHPLCHGMVRSTLGMSPTKALPSLRRDEDCWATISKSIANAFNSGAKIAWMEYHRDFQAALKLLDLPSYAFDLKNYWIQHEGDWSLTKGDKTNAVTQTLSSRPAFSTTCLQHIENEKFTKDSASVDFSSRLDDPKLNTAVRGHLVNGTGLCPSSVYADVAFTAAWYIASRMTPNDPVPAMDLSTMEVFKPLIVDSTETSQLLKVTATRRSDEQIVKIQISSQDQKGRQDHANCTVMYGDGQQWIDEWQRNAYLVQSRIDQLFKPSNPSSVHRLLKDMIYRQFQTVVTYSKEYHNIDELFMDCELNETAANIKFQPSAANGHFVYSPYWIDTVAHLAGFILNASVKTPADTVFISHGWQSFRIAKPLSDEKSYRGYVRMQPSGNRGVMAGDVYIFDGDEIVVVCRGIKFQQMKRTILQSLLSSAGQETTPAPRVVAPKKTVHFPIATPKPVAASVTGGSSGGFLKVLEIIASEVGVDVKELSDDAKISDLGVDSLLTISILGRLRPETGLDLPSSLFIAYPTVAQLRAFFLDKIAVPQLIVEDVDSDDSSSDEGSSRFFDSHGSSTLNTPPDEADIVSTLMATIAREVGMDIDEIHPSTPFADIGVDSLLTISILDSFKSQVGMNLAASFFHENPTFADVRKALGAPSVPDTLVETPRKSSKTKPAQTKQDIRSKSVLLQGRPFPDRSSLFLLPDGAGSLFSYISLPALPSGVAVYGLDSPFHNNPSDYTLSFEEVASIYIREIRSIQPKGPYMLGGWSLGGIHAYEVSRQLIAQGETITNLLMIDSPCPGTLPPLPSPTLNLLEKAGVFDGLSSSSGPITERTRLHFLGSVRALESYKVAPLPADRSPGKVTVIWAQDGVLEGRDQAGEDVLADPAVRDVNADMDKAKQWLTGKRTSFGPSGWDKLTGADVQCHVVGGNHFSIMFPPKVRSHQPRFEFVERVADQKLDRRRCCRCGQGSSISLKFQLLSIRMRIRSFVDGLWHRGSGASGWTHTGSIGLIGRSLLSL